MNSVSSTSSQGSATGSFDDPISTHSNLQRVQSDVGVSVIELGVADIHVPEGRFDASAMPSSIRPDSPTNSTTSNLQHHTGKRLNMIAAIEEPAEDHAFLPKKDHGSTSVELETSPGRVSRSALITTWWTELLSLVLAIGALIAIAVTMAEYNKKEQPAWKHTISLNTLVAVLSTLLRACMVFVVEEGKRGYSMVFSAA